MTITYRGAHDNEDMSNLSKFMVIIELLPDFSKHLGLGAR